MDRYMQEAINEAICSLREGTHGFGCVIIKNNSIIVKAHDLEETDNDPTSHAEINAVRAASKIPGKNLKGCILLSTHEPCPTLEACKILGLDTRYLCRRYNENSTDTLIKQIDKRLEFPGNYDKLRPYADYCEETITLNDKCGGE